MEGERTGKTGMTGLLLSVVPTREERWREREDCTSEELVRLV